jgi:hypothetical protein
VWLAAFRHASPDRSVFLHFSKLPKGRLVTHDASMLGARWACCSTGPPSQKVKRERTDVPLSSSGAQVASVPSKAACPESRRAVTSRDRLSRTSALLVGNTGRHKHPIDMRSGSAYAFYNSARLRAPTARPALAPAAQQPTTASESRLQEHTAVRPSHEFASGLLAEVRVSRCLEACTISHRPVGRSIFGRASSGWAMCPGTRTHASG